MKNKKIRRRIRILLLAVIAVCLSQIGREYVLSAQHKTQQEALRDKLELAEKGDETGIRLDAEKTDRIKKETDAERPDIDEQEKAPVEEEGILEKYAGLHEENKDLIGWLCVEGTQIDYPVMQNEDDEYYLHHDFDGKESKYGCLYVRNRADIEDGTNFIIYGHNMKDGSMFGELDLYLEQDFYREHPVLHFDSLYEARIYDVIAVFRSQVYGQEEDVFKYYQFYEADTEEEFDDFYQNIKGLSVYDTGVEAAFGDRFITLSTCAYHVEDGRLVVVARLQE